MRACKRPHQGHVGTMRGQIQFPTTAGIKLDLSVEMRLNADDKSGIWKSVVQCACGLRTKQMQIPSRGSSCVSKGKVRALRYALPIPDHDADLKGFITSSLS